MQLTESKFSIQKDDKRPSAAVQVQVVGLVGSAAASGGKKKKHPERRSYLAGTRTTLDKRQSRGESGEVPETQRLQLFEFSFHYAKRAMMTARRADRLQMAFWDEWWEEMDEEEEEEERSLSPALSLSLCAGLQLQETSTGTRCRSWFTHRR